MSSWMKIWKALTTPVHAPQAKEQDLGNTQQYHGTFKDHWLAIHTAIAAMREFQECSSYHPMQENAENLRNIVEELRNLARQPYYPAILKKGVLEFEKNWETKIAADELERIEHPDAINVENLIYEKYHTLAQDYRNYWEDAIAQLVRKSAIQKRRKYLVEDIDRFINALPVNYPEILDELEKYKAFNLVKIENLE